MHSAFKKEVMKTMPKRNYKAIALAILFSCLLAAVQIYVYVRLTSDTSQVVMFRILFLICLLYCFIPAAVIIRINKNYKLEANVYYLQQQKDASEKRASLLKASQEKTEAQMKQIMDQMTNLQQLLEKGQIEEAKSKIGTLSTSFQHNRYRHYSTNHIIDTILHSKEMEAAEQNIKVTYHITFPEETTLPDSALISLFFNLLDNGIEACIASHAANPFLQLNIDYKGDYLLIHMINSKNPNLVFDHKTTKENPEFHGLGLSIMEKLAKDHDGTWEWIDEKDRFLSKIMLRYQE